MHCQVPDAGRLFCARRFKLGRVPEHGLGNSDCFRNQCGCFAGITGHSNQRHPTRTFDNWSLAGSTRNATRHHPFTAKPVTIMFSWWRVSARGRSCYHFGHDRGGEPTLGKNVMYETQGRTSPMGDVLDVRRGDPDLLGSKHDRCIVKLREIMSTCHVVRSRSNFGPLQNLEDDDEQTRYKVFRRLGPCFKRMMRTLSKKGPWTNMWGFRVLEQGSNTGKRGAKRGNIFTLRRGEKLCFGEVNLVMCALRPRQELRSHIRCTQFYTYMHTCTAIL